MLANNLNFCMHVHISVSSSHKNGHWGDQWNPQKERAGRVLWLLWGFLCGSPACVSYGPSGWYLWASIERTDRMSLIWPGNPSSMAVLGEKLGGRPADHSAGLRVVSAALFLGSSRVRPMLLVACERLPRTGTARRKRMSGIHGLAWKAYVSCWSGFSLQGVHRFESSRLWDMSNCLFVAAIK
jgi:hypothetical protein